MTTINAYINFDGNCREAMDFYKECLGGELTIQTVGGLPMESHSSPEMKDLLLHSSLMQDGLLIMGSDMQKPGGFTKGDNIALSVNCSSEEEINQFFNNLSKGGKIVHHLKMEFWGALFGVLTDKFGIRWILNFNKNQKVN